MTEAVQGLLPNVQKKEFNRPSAEVTGPPRQYQEYQLARGNRLLVTPEGNTFGIRNLARLANIFRRMPETQRQELGRGGEAIVYHVGTPPVEMALKERVTHINTQPEVMLNRWNSIHQAW